MDVKTLRPILKPKNQKVTDPPRYPKVINVYENESKRMFTDTLQRTLVDLTKTMVDLKKEGA